MNSISRQTARRFVLGRHGLWPGRRAEGKAGTEAAIRQAECIQVDTINTVARSHDLALWSRVAGYRPEHLDALLYEDREFFDYGGILMIYPASELPYWRAVMARRQAAWEERHGPMGDIHRFVLDELRSRGPLANRDFAGRGRIPGGFNTVKDTDFALYRLWISGHVMTHSRRGFERVYGLPAHIPKLHDDSAAVSIEEAERHFELKALRDCGLATPSEWARRATVMLGRRVFAKEAAKMLEPLVADGDAMTLHVEGRDGAVYAPADSRATLQALEGGGTPEDWTPLAISVEEANLLAPLDNVIWDRARTQRVFDFDYVWEVYKPASQRRWGYYTLPILWDDRLVGRLWPHLYRKVRTLAIEGMWLEDEADWKNGPLMDALAQGLKRLVEFVGADRLDARGITRAPVRRQIEAKVNGKRRSGAARGTSSA